ncbi:YicC family protein [Vandammella animalimorsus]|uniref:YicC family protein n=1 Tax=Vandammella animalimorsus TaxID=2029117 RepID=A0A2A2ALW6_9BURK|nr:YicC/YloC family endoribonuclease [Vandammella animalimorsus]PAT39570.1 YicC family protein [Vandammella animalimorsus]
MAVNSMTGYASLQQQLQQQGQDMGLGMELRSVNSRFLDLVLKVPEALKAHEARIRQLLTEHLARGKVEVRMTLRRSEAVRHGALQVEALQRLAHNQAWIQSWFPDARSLSVAEILQLQAQPQDERDEHELLWDEACEQLVLDAIASLREARQAEGARLAQGLAERTRQLQHWVRQAEPLVPQVVAQQQQKFLDRWHEALAPALEGAADAPPALDRKELEQRAMAEATAFAMRVDVAEELTRLEAHLQEVLTLLDKGGVIGKRLDFLMQELHREANTLGSKSPVLELSRISMEMKVLIEQMREQVQNIE